MSSNPYKSSNIEQDVASKATFGCYQFIVFGVVVFVVLMVFGLIWQGVRPAAISRPFPPSSSTAK